MVCFKGIKSVKEPFSRCTWNVADQKNGMTPNAKYIQ